MNVWNRYGNRYLGTFAGDACDFNHTSEFLNAFADALKAEMTLQNAGRGIGIETTAVVGDGTEERRLVKRTGDPDDSRISVANRVDDKLADDAEKGMGGVVGDLGTGDVESHGHAGVVDGLFRLSPGRKL